MLSSLPLRPLTLAETNALDGSAQIDICKPIIGLREEDPTDAIVAVYLGIGSAVHLLVYESTAEGWESLESLSTTDGNEAFDAATDRIVEWASEYYGADRIVVLTPADPEADVLLSIFPRCPISVVEAFEFETLPDIEAVHPMFCFLDTSEVIVVLVTVRDAVDPMVATLYAVGYDETTQAWEIVSAKRIVPDDVPDTHAGEELQHWVRDRYDADRIAVVAPSER